MGDYFSYAYDGAAFIQFGTTHIITLAVIALITIILVLYPSSARQRRRICRSIAVILLINELAWHTWHVYYGLWSIQTMLPLHLCNLLVFISAFSLLTKNQTGYEFLYFLGITGAAQVLITPGLGAWGFPHFLYLQTFISHGGIVISAVYLTAAEKMRPRSWVSLGQVIVTALLYGGIIFFINPLLESNYLFLAYKPAAATLLDYLGPWPWYVLPIIGIGIVQAVLLYLPFAWLDHQENLKKR